MNINFEDSKLEKIKQRLDDLKAATKLEDVRNHPVNTTIYIRIGKDRLRFMLKNPIA